MKIKKIFFFSFINEEIKEGYVIYYEYKDIEYGDNEWYWKNLCLVFKYFEKEFGCNYREELNIVKENGNIECVSWLRDWFFMFILMKDCIKDENLK